jgi:hypothetical protein
MPSYRIKVAPSGRVTKTPAISSDWLNIVSRTYLLYAEQIPGMEVSPVVFR